MFSGLLLYIIFLILMLSLKPISYHFSDIRVFVFSIFNVYVKEILTTSVQISRRYFYSAQLKQSRKLKLTIYIK